MRIVRGRTKPCRGCRQIKRLSEFYRQHTVNDGHRARCKACIDPECASLHNWYRAQVFEHYGNACVCCGSTRRLHLDHVHGNGPEHRELTGNAAIGGPSFYAWLISRDFPDECEPGGEFELQTLCGRCNISKWNGDRCKLHGAGADPSPGRWTLAELAADKALRDARILELRGQGWTQPRIAAEIGCSQSTVCHVLRMAGLQSRPRRRIVHRRAA
jgi:hypothetical protein